MEDILKSDPSMQHARNVGREPAIQVLEHYLWQLRSNKYKINVQRRVMSAIVIDK